MARHRLDISYGYDDMSQVGYWAPETPEFLEKREERRAASRSYAMSYTQAKANIRRISVQNQANSPTRRQADAPASIIDFEHLDRNRYRSDARNDFPEHGVILFCNEAQKGCIYAAFFLPYFNT